MNEFEYPLVIGNIIHETFERLLITRNFEESNLEEVFKESMKNHFCHLYRLKETEEKVLRDLKIASTNIKLWISNMLDRKSFKLTSYIAEKNNYGIIFEKAIASEQEFNSCTYGIKGKIDATIVVKNSHSPDFDRITALELKTGREQVYHKG